MGLIETINSIFFNITDRVTLDFHGLEYEHNVEALTNSYLKLKVKGSLLSKWFNSAVALKTVPASNIMKGYSRSFWKTLTRQKEKL